MTGINKIKQLFRKRTKEISSADGYDIWAEKYDDQSDNLMLALDEIIFADLLNEIDVQNKTVVDIGCGTGRHWQKLLAKQPLQLTGYDVSEGMLDKLRRKFPQAKTHLLLDNKLTATETGSCDVIISTLTIAHIQDAKDALKEWNRILKPAGSLILTDYHPAVLQKGGQRTFKHNGKTIAVKNYIHSLDKIREIGGQLHWSLTRLTERHIDDWTKPYYEKQNALSTFETFKGMPVIYGMLFKKEQ